MVTLKRGDHIYISRWLGLYEHHGIYCGDGTVIHYTSDSGPKGKVKRMALTAFGPLKKIRVKKYKRCGPPHAVIKRAEEALGESKYNLFFNNCEHFACYCKVGRRRSKQIAELKTQVQTSLSVGTYVAFGVPAPFPEYEEEPYYDEGVD